MIVNNIRFESACEQDVFALLCNNSKHNGYFIDIGSGAFKHENNTYTLDRYFGWNGLCFDILDKIADYYSSERNCKYFQLDCSRTNFWEVFVRESAPEVIDYLSVDVDEATLITMKNIPFNYYKFGVITIEHDYYRNKNDSFRGTQRAILKDHGYHLLCEDVCVDIRDETGGPKMFATFKWEAENANFEDWWVHPDLVDLEKLKPLQSTGQYALDIVRKLISIQPQPQPLYRFVKCS